MKWFYKWLYEKIKKSAEEVQTQVEEDKSYYRNRPKLGTVGSSSNRFETNGMNFTLFTASGGYILEYHSYDSKVDEHTKKLHIITSDQDLGQSIAHIITLELLSK